MDLETVDRLAELSSGTRRLMDFVAVLPEGAPYAVLRHIARVSEEDMVIDLREAVDAGLLAPVPGQPEVYQLVGDGLHEHLLDTIGPARLPRLQARANAAMRRVRGPDDYA
jgi:hypothetical protein